MDYLWPGKPGEIKYNDKVKKVLDIMPYSYLPYFSGGQKSIAQFLEYLGMDADLTVIGTINNDAAFAKNYTHVPLLKKSFYRYFDLTLLHKTV